MGAEVYLRGLREGVNPTLEALYAPKGGSEVLKLVCCPSPSHGIEEAIPNFPAPSSPNSSALSERFRVEAVHQTDTI